MQAGHIALPPHIAHHHQHTASNGGLPGPCGAVLVPPTSSPARPRSRTNPGAPGSSLARRCDSSSSIASLLFEFEGDELVDGKDAGPHLRLPSELQQIVDVVDGTRSSTQTVLWMDALEARAHVVREQQGGFTDALEDDQAAEEHNNNSNSSGRTAAAAAAAAATEEDTMVPHLAPRASAPVPMTGGLWQRPDAASELSFLFSASAAPPRPQGNNAHNNMLTLRSVGSSCLGASTAANGDMGMAGVADEPAVDIRRFAQSLADLGHCTWVRSGLYQCPPESGINTIRHKFVVVSVPSDLGHAGQPTYYVIDPNYLSHFQLAAKGLEADHYRKMLAMLPSVFVGTADQLAGMVNRLCKEMEKVFAARGVPLPPWRSPRVMQGRWLVNQVLEDEHVPATPPGTPLQPVLMLQGGRTFSGELRERLPALPLSST